MSILSVDQISPIGSGTTITLTSTETKTGNIITVGTGASVFSPAGNTLALGTNNTERLRITNAGAFGLSGTNYGSSGQVLTSAGSGSAPTWSAIPAQATIANNADNRVITGGSGVNLNGEANLTFDGTELKIGGDSSVAGTFGLEVYNTASNEGTALIAGTQGARLDIMDTGSSERIRISASGAIYFISYKSGDDIIFQNTTGSGTAERFRVKTDGIKVTSANANGSAIQMYNTDSSSNVWYVNGEGNSFQGHTYPRTDSNLDLGYHATNKWRDVVLSGGIRFGSANEVDYLDDYNEGVFQPYYDSTNSNLTFHGGTAANNSYYTSRSGSYVKIGKRVFFQISLSTNGLTVVGGTGQMRISGLPFTAAPNAFGVGSSTYPRAVISCMGGRFNSFTPNYLVVNQGTSNLQVREAFTTYGQAVGGTGGFDTSGSSNRNVIEAYGYYDVSN